MTTIQETQEILSAINKMEESRKGGWIHHSKLNISTKILIELIDAKFIEPGGMYSRLTQHAKATLAAHGA
jgi:hypothetical protein